MEYRVCEGSDPVSCDDAIQLWQNSELFRTCFIDCLETASYSVYRWETPALTRKTLSRTFRFVLVESPEILMKADPAPFARYLAACPPGHVTSFSNLGNDALLVAPAPDEYLTDFSHLAAFTRKAPRIQQHRLWQQVGEAMQKRVSSDPVWLNTAGGGVGWLHVRLDDAPKYYRYSPYRNR